MNIRKILVEVGAVCISAVAGLKLVDLVDTGIKAIKGKFDQNETE
jgi:hypothetical protein